MYACEKRASAEVIKVLIEKGAEVNKADMVREACVYTVYIHIVITVVCVYKLLLCMYISTVDKYEHADVCFLSYYCTIVCSYVLLTLTACYICVCICVYTYL